MNDFEATIEILEAIALALEQVKQELPQSRGGMGDRVAGIQVIRDGQIIQEWHDERSP